MVGQLGTAELAAVSLGNSFVFIAMSLGIGFSTAITPLVAEADGAGNKAGGKSALKARIIALYHTWNSSFWPYSIGETVTLFNGPTP